MAKETIRKRTHESVDKIMDKAENMKDRGKEAMGNLKERVIKTRENVDGYIAKNPEKSVWIAAGVGAVIGATLAVILMRKRH